jgi:putative phosphoribosyl transferase
MGMLIEDPTLRDRQSVFTDRAEAGRLLAAKLFQYGDSDSLVLAIPAGGMPVAAEISRALNLPLDLVLVRKIQMPNNTEAGFGAMDADGETIFNEGLLEQLKLSQEELREQTDRTKRVLEHRGRVFREGRPYPSLEGKVVIVVDDGLASGYTMRAAIRYVRKRRPAKVVVAVPTGFRQAVNGLLPETDEMVCLNIRSGFRFAVASAYANWSDVSDEEVFAFLAEGKERNP